MATLSVFSPLIKGQQGYKWTSMCFIFSTTLLSSEKEEYDTAKAL